MLLIENLKVELGDKILLDHIDLQIKSGETVNLASHDGQIVIAAIRQQRFKLADLLKGVTSRNKHEEVVTGNPVGLEVW